MRRLFLLAAAALVLVGPAVKADAAAVKAEVPWGVVVEVQQNGDSTVEKSAWPRIRDALLDRERCSVRGCTRRGEHYHHDIPRYSHCGRPGCHIRGYHEHRRMPPPPVYGPHGGPHGPHGPRR